MLVLKVLQGPDRDRTFSLPEGEPQLIGRSSEALPITDTTVSRRHAELTPDDGAWWVRDLESANGTFVNGTRLVARTRLAPGDQIRCGSTLLVFSTAADVGDRTAEARLIEPGELDVTVERTSDPNADSMILGAPDPVKAARDHLRVLYELVALTAGHFEAKPLLEAVMSLVFAEFRPDRGFVLLGTDPAGPLEPIVVRYRERPKSLDEGRVPVSRTIIQHVLGRGEGILSTNAMSDRRFSSGDSVQDYGIRSAVCVPIVGGERMFGVIQIDSQLAHFTFTDSQLRLLAAIGQLAGLALLSAERVRSRVRTERLAAMGEAVASLSHSIKNILQGLRGGADAVELSLNRGEVELAKEAWPILARNVDRILALTLNMLAWSRPATPELELADLNALVREVALLVERQAEHRRVALMLDLDEDVPPVPLDPNGIHQALMNVTMNAVEAAPPRHGVVTIATRYHADRHEAEIAVADNGPGVPAAMRETIFEPFHSSKGQRGTGLGLAVTRRIVEEHDGSIELAGGDGGGACFRILLPTDRETLDGEDTRLPRAIGRDPLGES